MSWLGNYREDETNLNFAFLTIETGPPSATAGTLVGGVVSVYKGSNLTPKDSSESYITLDADYDGITGLNHVSIDLSGDVFFEVNEDYFVVITAGTEVGSLIYLNRLCIASKHPGMTSALSISSWYSAAT